MQHLAPCQMTVSVIWALAGSLCHYNTLHQIVWLCSSSTSAIDRLLKGDAQELPKERLQEAVAKYALCAFNFTDYNANNRGLFCCTVCMPNLLPCFTPDEPRAHSNMLQVGSNVVMLQRCGKGIQALSCCKRLAAALLTTPPPDCWDGMLHYVRPTPAQSRTSQCSHLHLAVLATSRA